MHARSAARRIEAILCVCVCICIIVVKVYFLDFNCYMKRENNRVKIRIIMQEQEPQRRAVQLKENRREQDHFVVMATTISLNQRRCFRLAVDGEHHSRTVEVVPRKAGKKPRQSCFVSISIVR